MAAHGKRLDSLKTILESSDLCILQRHNDKALHYGRMKLLLGNATQRLILYKKHIKSITRKQKSRQVISCILVMAALVPATITMSRKASTFELRCERVNDMLQGLSTICNAEMWCMRLTGSNHVQEGNEMCADRRVELFGKAEVKQDELKSASHVISSYFAGKQASILPPDQDIAWMKIPAPEVVNGWSVAASLRLYRPARMSQVACS